MMSALLRAFQLGANSAEAYGLVLKHWRKRYLHTLEDQQRRNRARRRLELYREKGEAIYRADVMQLFDSPVTQRKRMSVLPLAKGGNLISRLVKQLATLYQQQARRRVAGEANSVYFQLALRALGREHGYNARWAEIQRLLVLCKSLLVGVRGKEGLFAGERMNLPVMDVITPDAFCPIPHPRDPTELLAVIIDDAETVLNEHDESAARTRRSYTVWSEDETFSLNSAFELIPGTLRQHSLGRVPYVLLTFEPVLHGLIDGSSGESLEVAQRAMVFLRTEELHGVRTGVKVPYQLLDGEDTTRREQVMDKDSITQFSNTEGVGTLDLQHEPARFQESMRRIEGDVAADHGVPPDIFDQSWTTMTGDAFVAKRASLDEQRMAQKEPFRAYERAVLELAARVCATDAAPWFRFTMDGFAIDFGEPRTPQTPMQELTMRREQRALGLGSPITDIMERNPDIESRAEAEELLSQNLRDNARWISLSRELNINFQTLEGSGVEVFGSLESLLAGQTQHPSPGPGQAGSVSR